MLTVYEIINLSVSRDVVLSAGFKFKNIRYVCGGVSFVVAEPNDDVLKIKEIWITQSTDIDKLLDVLSRSRGRVVFAWVQSSRISWYEFSDGEVRSSIAFVGKYGISVEECMGV